jgi:hypothetical protein
MPHRPTPTDAGLDRARFVRQVRDEVCAGKYRIDIEAIIFEMARRLRAGAGTKPARRASGGVSPQAAAGAESPDVLRYPMRMDRDNNNIIKCTHPTAEPLGFNNGMAFFRCLTCRSVIVTQGALRLAIPSVRTAG